MRRILLILAVMALLMVALAVPAFAQAAGNGAINLREPWTIELTSCTGEPFTLEGEIHVVAHPTVDSAGGAHFNGHINIQGRGQTASGDKYVLNHTSMFEGKSDANSADVSTDTVHLNLIRQGEDGTEDDLSIPLRIHFTQNANGEYTAEYFFGDIVCQ